jgi:hypothetical protein
MGHRLNRWWVLDLNLKLSDVRRSLFWSNARQSILVMPSYYSSYLKNLLIYHSCFFIIGLRRRRAAISVHSNSLQLPTKRSFDASSHKPSPLFSFIIASPSTSKHHKVIIVGAGVNGILAAKTCLQIKPDVDILIIDSEKSIGGVWVATGIYPGLIFEPPAPTMNFSDFNICKELGIEKCGDVTGSQFNEFLVCSLPLSAQVWHL